MSRIIVLLLLAGLASTFSPVVCQANQTRVYFGYFPAVSPGDELIHSSFKVTRNYIVFGDYFEDVTVSFSGNEIDYYVGESDYRNNTPPDIWFNEEYRLGVGLSAKDNLLGGGKGEFQIYIPSAVDMLAVGFDDASADWSDGCDIKMKTLSGAGDFVSLESQMGGDASARYNPAIQFFKPRITTGNSSVRFGAENLITVSAHGYDEFIVFYVDIFWGTDESELRAIKNESPVYIWDQNMVFSYDLEVANMMDAIEMIKNSRSF